MIEQGIKYSDLSKEIVMNMMDFTERMSIKNIVLLLDRRNKDYIKILQGMMTVGFTNEEKMKTVKISEKEYKVLKMTLKHLQDEIQEIAF